MLEKLQKTEDKLFKLFSKASSANSLASLQKRAWDQFMKMGFPTNKNEAFQYIPLRKIAAKDLEGAEAETVKKEELLPFVLPECSGSCVVFVNGFFSKELSDVSSFNGSAGLFSLTDAMNSYGIFLQNRFAKTFKEEKDPFSFLNFALHKEGAFLHVFPNKVLEKPLQILHVSTKNSETLFSARFHAVVGKGSEATFVSTYACLGSGKYWLNQAIDIAVEENAKASWYEASFLSDTAWHTTSFRSTLKKHGSLRTLSFTDGAECARGSYHISLLEEGSSAEVKGLSLLQEEKESHIHVLLHHEAPSAHSRQHFKTVLVDAAKSSFEGKIKVDSVAQKTEAYQLCNYLLLSDKAQGNAKPNLEIFADDVKASHGATFAQLGKEELFYLQTRGLSQRDAKKLLTLGFCKELLEEVALSSIKKWMSDAINAYFQRGI